MPHRTAPLEENILEFRKRGVSVLGVSCDSVFAHLEWLSTPRNEGGIEGISFILLSDIKKTMAFEFGILNEDTGVPFRGTFIVNRSGLVVYGAINNLFVGRNTDELVRLIDAFQFTEKHKDLCPIDWKPGDPTIPDNLQGSHDYYARKFGSQ